MTASAQEIPHFTNTHARQFALVVKERELLQYKTDEKLGRSLNYILSSIFRETWM